MPSALPRARPGAGAQVPLNSSLEAVDAPASPGARTHARKCTSCIHHHHHHHHPSPPSVRDGPGSVLGRGSFQTAPATPKPLKASHTITLLGLFSPQNLPSWGTPQEIVPPSAPILKIANITQRTHGPAIHMGVRHPPPAKICSRTVPFPCEACVCGPFVFSSALLVFVCKPLPLCVQGQQTRHQPPQPTRIAVCGLPSPRPRSCGRGGGTGPSRVPPPSF